MRRSVVVACILAIGLLGACGDSDEDGSTATNEATATGRVAAFLVEVDATEGELTYDQIDFLTGDAARDAYRRDNPDADEDAPNDYYIVNKEPVFKVAPIAPNAQVDLNILSADNPGSENAGGSVAELADAFVEGKLTPDGRDRSEIVGTRPFWLTLNDDGVVVKIEEQYTP